MGKFIKNTEENLDVDKTWRSKDVQCEWKEWMKAVNHILMESFGIVRITENVKQGLDEETRKLIQEKRELRKKANSAENNETKNKLINDRKEIEMKIGNRIEENEEAKLYEATQRLSDKRNNYDVLWKIKRISQKKQTNSFILKDPKGNEIRKPKEIKEKVYEHYKELYKNNEAKEEYKEYNKELDKLIDLCWKYKDEKKQLKHEDIMDTMKNLEHKRATGPCKISNEMIQSGGKSWKNSILRMMKIVYETEEIPEEWNKAFIKNIYKGKGSKKEMNNYRGIVLNSHLAKMFEKIIETKERETLQNMSEFQCGARKGKSIREHHLTIRTIKDLAKVEKEEVTAVYFDIQKCFDKMVLKETMKELWLKGIKGKHWRLIYKLNSNNILIPSTELGMCKPVKVDQMIKQGSVLGAVMSAITIDSLTRIIESNGKTWDMNGIKINPLLFQDDIIAANKTKDIKETIKIIETFQDIKRLKFHEEKSKKSILNGKTEENIQVNGIEIKRASSHKYLGKIVEEKHTEKEEIKARINKARWKVNESLSIINNSKLRNKIIDIGIKLLQTEIIPVLTFGAETWPKLTEKEKLEINNIQTQYLASMLKVPKTTPKCAFLYSLDLTKIEHIANLRKLEYFIHINQREERRSQINKPKRK